MAGSREWRAEGQIVVGGDCAFECINEADAKIAATRLLQYEVDLRHLTEALNAQQQELAEAQRERDEEKRLHDLNVLRAGEWAAKAGLAQGRAEAAEAREQGLREALEGADQRFVEIQQAEKSRGREYLRDAASWGSAEVRQALKSITPEEVKE